jgi:hypothetical protein
MDEQPPSYRAEFFRSKHHAWLGLSTLGLGFLFSSYNPLFFLFGAAAYVLGWIYLPDMPFFRRAVDGKRDAAEQADAARELAAFQQKRDALHASLPTHLRTRYSELAEVCREIEGATAEDVLSTAGSADPRLGRLDELMWTFLRLLSLEDSLERFLENERREDLPGSIRDAEAEIGDLGRELEALKKQAGSVSAQDTKERLLQSRLEALDVLRKRQSRVEDTQANLRLVHSEQERLENQIKLIRADAVASKNTTSISARIDATVENLNQTNKWLAEINEFKDSVGGPPPAATRVGYSPNPVPPKLPEAEKGYVVQDRRQRVRPDAERKS